MKEEKNAKPCHVSLALKLNLVTVSVILVLAGGLIAILFNSYMQKINQIYKDTIERSLFEALEECDKSPITYDMGNTALSSITNLCKLLGDNEFYDIVQRAVKEDNDILIWNWLLTKPSVLFSLEEELFSNMLESVQNGTYETANPEETLREISMAGEYDDLSDLLIRIQVLNGLDRLAILVPYRGNLCLLAESVSSGHKDVGWRNIGHVEDLSLNEDGSLPGYSPADFIRDGDNIVLRAYTPVYVATEGDEMEPIGIILAEINMNTVLREYNWFLVRSMAFVAVLILLAILVSIFLTRRIATKPLRLLACGTQQFGKGEEGYTRDGIISLPIHSRDEIGDLYHDISDMQTRIVDYVDDLARITSERERIVAELHLASDIQNAMLPGVFPAFPDRMDFDLHASMVPAKDVGGDFYGFFLIDSDHLALLIADVSGKGIPAALFMMASVITITDRAMARGTPAEILTAANASICKNNRMSMFVTVWMGILDLRTGKMTCANAGHEFPMVRKNGVFSMMRDPHGLVMGGFASMKYKNYEIQLGPGDAVYVYTDGVAEAADPSGTFYGTDRLLKTLNAHAAATPKEILAAVSKDVNAFVNGAEQFDDITMLCVEYKGAKQSES